MLSYKRIQIDVYLSPCSKLKSMCKRHKHKSKYTVCDRKKVEISLECIHKGQHHEQATNSTETKINSNKWDLIKLKRFCNTKDSVMKKNPQPTE